jgi:hypothetical protein
MNKCIWKYDSPENRLPSRCFPSLVRVFSLTSYAGKPEEEEEEEVRARQEITFPDQYISQSGSETKRLPLFFLVFEIYYWDCKQSELFHDTRTNRERERANRNRTKRKKTTLDQCIIAIGCNAAHVVLVARNFEVATVAPVLSPGIANH